MWNAGSFLSLGHLLQTETERQSWGANDHNLGQVTPLWLDQNWKQLSAMNEERETFLIDPPPPPRDRALSCHETGKGRVGVLSLWLTWQKEPSSKSGPRAAHFYLSASLAKCSFQLVSHVEQSTSTYSNLKHRNKGLQNGILITVRTKAVPVWISQLQQH